MDPNETLATQRRLAARLIAMLDTWNGGHDSDFAAAAYELSECTTALDEWLANGGFLPHAWKRVTMKSPDDDAIFIALDNGFLCESCNEARPETTKLDVTLDEVQVWEVGSRGWTAPCVCVDCKLSIPVYVDGAP